MGGLIGGRAQSVVVIAARECLGGHQVRRLLRLAFLAPQIVEAIAAGHQPPELTAEALAKRIDLPLLWNEQLLNAMKPRHARIFAHYCGECSTSWTAWRMTQSD